MVSFLQQPGDDFVDRASLSVMVLRNYIWLIVHAERFEKIQAIFLLVGDD